MRMLYAASGEELNPKLIKNIQCVDHGSKRSEKSHERKLIPSITIAFYFLACNEKDWHPIISNDYFCVVNFLIHVDSKQS